MPAMHDPQVNGVVRQRSTTGLMIFPVSGTELQAVQAGLESTRMHVYLPACTPTCGSSLGHRMDSGNGRMGAGGAPTVSLLSESSE